MRTPSRFFGVVFLAACVGKDADTSAAVTTPPDDSPTEGGCEEMTFYEDADGDGFGLESATTLACTVPSGFVSTPGDCADDDIAIHPWAAEVCDGVDNNCNGLVDDTPDVRTWYTDLDHDGYGDLDASPLSSCTELGEGWSESADDCDDALSNVHPGADETCDDLDNDCDGAVDQDDDDLVDGWTRYDDLDGDGFGDPLTGHLSCEDEGVANDGDCDDTEPASYESAKEICDGIDNDCDGDLDTADVDFVGLNVYYPDADGDGLGDLTYPVEACSVPSGYVENWEDCDDADAAIGGPSNFHFDSDLDGYGDAYVYVMCESTSAYYVTLDGDCQPGDPGSFPGAPEICDTIDNNCDGTVDTADPLLEGATYFADVDGDGFGDDLASVITCDEEAALGYVSIGGDCDDTSEVAFPDAPELCDSVDNDCDGVADDDTENVDWYADLDGDGYGDAAELVSDCSEPAGYDRDLGDCDDADASVHPDADEACGDGTDNDCDGVQDNCASSVADYDFGIEGSAGYENTGNDVLASDLDDDGTDDLVVAAVYGGSTYEGRVYLQHAGATGVIEGGDADVVITGPSAYAQFGSSIAAGDVDGDGTSDLAVGAAYVSAVYVFEGPITSDLGAASADATLGTSPWFDYAGTSVETVRDVSGDGVHDLVVGAPYASDAGSFYVVAGPLSGSLDLATSASATYVGPESYAYVGADATGIDDLDGDGLGELAFGSSMSGGTTHGAVYVVAGGETGTFTMSDVATATVVGSEASDMLGSSLASSDYDGDGYADLLAGTLAGSAGGVLDTGTVHAFFGPMIDTLDPSDADVTWAGETLYGSFGSSVAVGGDFDGDGRGDVVIGAPSEDDSSGAAYVFSGDLTGFISASMGIQLSGEADQDAAGRSVAWLGDWDGDGRSDVVVGANGATSTDGYGAAGRAYVVGSSGF